MLIERNGLSVIKGLLKYKKYKNSAFTKQKL